MTVGELRRALTDYDDDEEVTITWKNLTVYQCTGDILRMNNGHPMLISEEEIGMEEIIDFVEAVLQEDDYNAYSYKELQQMIDMLRWDNRSVEEYEQRLEEWGN